MSGLVRSQATTSLSTGGLFGNKTNQPTQNQIYDPLMQRFNNIKNAYDSNTTNYRFYSIVYNNKTGKSPMKPAFITDEDWDKARASSFDPLKFDPSPLVGFSSLESRSKGQIDLINLMKSKYTDMKNKIQELNSSFDILNSNQIKEIQEKNNEISKLLMKVLETEEVKSLSSVTFSIEEHELLDQLEKIQEEINQPNKFIAALNTLSLKSKLLQDSTKISNELNFENKSLTKSLEILKYNTKALRSLEDTFQIIKDEYENFEKNLNNKNLN